MNRNLRIKAVIIIAVILICLYGVIGIPTSKAQLIENWHKNIHLGLDLRGGSQLVMQVQVQDAFKAEADATIDRIKEELKKAGIDYGNIGRNDPDSIQDADKIQINIKGVPVDQGGRLPPRDQRQFGGVWNLTPVNQTDYRMTMKPTEALKLRKDTVTPDAEHHREEDQRPGPDRIDRAGSAAIRRPTRSCWCRCRAWTIRRA